MDLSELKQLHDKAYEANTVTRDKASDDLVFYWVTQWDDNLLSESQLQYRGEFNILRKAGRDLIGNLRANNFQVDFDPVDADREDGADLMDGIYRSSERHNTSIEAYNNAMQETVVCGVSAWEIYTEYETNALGDDKQVIKRRPLYESNNNVFWDPNSQLLDRSDSDYVSVLVAYSEDGYRKEVARLQGIPVDEVDVSNFKTPNESYAFPWVYENALYYITRFYMRELVTEKNYILRDPFGNEMTVRDFELEKIEDDMIESGFEIIGEKPVERYVVTLYYASGAEIIAEYRVAGQNIPIVPYFGETQYVEGQMSYEGITRLAKDPQRLHNFQMSYLADIVSRSPRPKPIFTADQLSGFEHMYEENGADNNYPYLLQNAYDANGNPLPLGPAGMMPEQPMPSALAASFQLTREAINDVANPGVPQDIMDTELSGKAVKLMQSKIDEQWYVYRDNFKHAKRRDGVIFAGMASEVIDSPRELTLTMPDGSRNKVQVMDMVVDKDSGEVVPLNDITGLEFEVYSDIGASFASQKEETLDRLAEMSQEIAGTDPTMHKMLLLKRMSLMDGVDFDSERKWARNQLILMGVEKPKDEEEEALLAQQAQQGQQPDAAMVLAQAEQGKAQAQQMKAQTDMAKAQADIQNNNAQTQIDGFKAQTDRMNMQVDAQKVGADIDYTRTKTLGQQIDNITKGVNPLRGSIA
jgi:hypothetical protein